MENIEEIKLAQKRINKILKEFKADKVFPKSKIIEYYEGLDTVYEALIEIIENNLNSDFSEKEAIMHLKELERF